MTTTATALAEVCGYHEGEGCEHCAETLAWKRDRGWTDAEILADIELYRTDFEAWADRVRCRAGLVA
jgi:hypothetical protein